MGLLDKILGTTFSERVDALREALVSLEESRACTRSDSKELKRIQHEWEPCLAEIRKGNESAVLSVLNAKYDKAVKNIEGALKRDAEVQDSLRKSISSILDKEPSLLRLLIADDFMSDDRYGAIACSLVKAHQEGAISDEPMHRLVSYRRENIDGDKLAYVRDGRTQYADVILMDNKNRVLFVVRNKNADFCPNGYCLAGGHIEANETPKDAALRELSEETGIVLTEAEIAPCGEYVDENSHIYYFICHKEVQPVCLQEEEQCQYEWVGMEDFDKKPLIMNLENNLRSLLAPDDVALGEAVVCYSNGKITKGLDSVADIRGLVGYSAIIKNDSISVFGDDLLEKAMARGKETLIRKKVFVTRGGRTFLTTVYVSPEGEIEDASKFKRARKAVDKEDEVESAVDLSGIGVGDIVEIEGPRGVFEGTIKGIRTNKRDGVFMSVETLSGLKVIYTKNIKRISKHSATEAKAEEKPKAEKPKVEVPKGPSVGAFIEDLKKGKFSFSSASTLGGSSDTYLFDADGEKFFVKRERSGKDGHLASESRADAVYRALGFDAPDSEAFTLDGENYKANKFVSAKEFGTLRGEERKKAIKEIQKGFALDCLLGNWDVIGANGDNILVNPDGSIVRIDNGSCFDYRAKGSRKDSSDFLKSTYTEELDSMRKGTKATDITKEVFGSLTDEEIASQIEALDLIKVVDTLDKIGAPRDVIRAIEQRSGYMMKWAEAKRLEKLAFEEKERLEKERLEKEEAARKLAMAKWGADPKDPAMHSVVTEEYFAGWDDFDFKANAECKATMKKNILYQEKQRQAGYKRVADEMGISVGEYKHMLQEKIEAILSVCVPSIAIDGNLVPKVFDEKGAFKCLFETGTGHGCTHKETRSRYEHAAFGFVDDVRKDTALRPKYGYMSNNERGAYSGGWSSGDDGIPPSASGYGNIIFNISRKKALESATFTFDDSLGRLDSYVPVPFGKPHFTAIYGCDRSAEKTKKIFQEIDDFVAGKTRSIPSQGSYLEVQYHNKLHWSDATAAHVNFKQLRGGEKEVNDIMNSLLKVKASGVEVDLYGFGK